MHKLSDVAIGDEEKEEAEAEKYETSLSVTRRPRPCETVVIDAADDAPRHLFPRKSCLSWNH